MLLGRMHECAVLDRLLGAGRAGHGGSLVVHGEPGIGKTALLEYAVSAATDFQVLRSTGHEAEVELPFAAMHQMCSPDPSVLEVLPEAQRIALQVATGQLLGPAPDRLLVGLAALSMTSQLAAGRPLLCVVDDTQWLDRESARAFAFVARRLTDEPIVLVFGSRVVTPEVRGLPELSIEGLGETAALTLLRSVLPDRVDDRVLERFVAEAHGNPLALIELPRDLTPAQLAGGFGAPVTAPLTGRIEAGFQRRLKKLPPASRRLLLVAAAEPTGDPVLVWRAAEQLGVEESAVAAIEAEGLLDLATRIVFRHPLVRSAVYTAATPEQRRAVHRALGEATDAAVDPDRRAWHLAQATPRPDDAVADDLELSAGRARARGGLAAAAAFLQRAAELTVDPSRRASRALSAAESKRQAGALDEALTLANLAQQGPLDDFGQAQVQVLRARVAFASDRGSEAPPLLLDAARRLEVHDPALARETYLDALTATLFAGGLATVCGPADVAKAALSAPRAGSGARASDLLLEGLALLIAEGSAAGTGPLRKALQAFRGDAVDARESLRWMWLAGRAAVLIWDYESWDALTARQIEVAREEGALTVLPLTLSTRAGVHLVAGELATAASLVEQVAAVADATDVRTAPYAAVMVAALRGHSAEAEELIRTTTEDFRTRGEGMGITGLRWSSALLYNGIGRYQDAFEAAAVAFEDPFGIWFSPWATVEYIEAAARTGRVEAATLGLERLTTATSAAGTAWGSAVEDRCRALVSEGTVAEGLYRAAIDSLASTVLRLDLARTRLLYGEWLRRERRNLEAREQLSAAHQMFGDFGIDGFAERARIELRAVGGRTRKPAAADTNALTPQEGQISRLVAQGLTNLEIAGQLFLSPSTVEYHLHKVFRKLGVKTRTQLARHALQGGRQDWGSPG
jgi:DNA-binding CsgD family transcriptional regulator